MLDNNAGDCRHTHRTSDEPALGNEFFCNDGHGGDASSGREYSVTHGAGRTAASVAPGGQQPVAIRDDVREHCL